MLKNFLSLRTTKLDLNPEKNVVSHVKIFSDLNRLQRKQKMTLMFFCPVMTFR